MGVSEDWCTLSSASRGGVHNRDDVSDSDYDKQ